MIELRDYQKRAVERLHQTVEDALRSSENEVIVFKAPTGSGKTAMVSEMLKELVGNRKDNKKFSFIWIAVRKLHEQSKEKLEKYYEDDRLIQCSYFEDLEDKKIGENEILFINVNLFGNKSQSFPISDMGRFWGTLQKFETLYTDTLMMFNKSSLVAHAPWNICIG